MIWPLLFPPSCLLSCPCALLYTVNTHRSSLGSSSRPSSVPTWSPCVCCSLYVESFPHRSSASWLLLIPKLPPPRVFLLIALSKLSLPHPNSSFTTSLFCIIYHCLKFSEKILLPLFQEDENSTRAEISSLLLMAEPWPVEQGAGAQ